MGYYVDPELLADVIICLIVFQHNEFLSHRFVNLQHLYFRNSDKLLANTLTLFLFEDKRDFDFFITQT